MNLDEMDRRDWNELEPEPPVSEERHDDLIRRVYREEVRWATEEGELLDEENHLELAYEMGDAARGRANYTKGYDDGYAAGILVAAKTAYGGKR